MKHYLGQVFIVSFNQQQIKLSFSIIEGKWESKENVLYVIVVKTLLKILTVDRIFTYSLLCCNLKVGKYYVRVLYVQKFAIAFLLELRVSSKNPSQNTRLT